MYKFAGFLADKRQIFIYFAFFFLFFLRHILLQQHPFIASIQENTNIVTITLCFLSHWLAQMIPSPPHFFFYHGGGGAGCKLERGNAAISRSAVPATWPKASRYSKISLKLNAWFQDTSQDNNISRSYFQKIVFLFVFVI